MIRSAAGRLLVVLLAMLAGAGCRRAEGVAQDPIDREAEAAFVQYLRLDTTNPPGNETRGAKFLQQLFAKEGIAVRLVGSDPNRQAVCARLESPAVGGALLLLSHIDVVPSDPAAWTKPPFSGDRSGGYIWGRGALDVKSLTIAHALSLIELKRKGTALGRDIVFLAVPDEELGGLRGTKALLESNPELFEGVEFVLNEGGTAETVVDKVVFWGIEVDQKIPLWLRVSASGIGGHGASPSEGGGAPAKLVRALAGIDRIETPYRLVPTVRDSLEAMRRVRRDPGASRLRAITEPLDPSRVDAELTPGYRSLLRDTIAITRISAGTSVNVIPQGATADIDIRLLPGTDPASMLNTVRQAAGEGAEIDVLLIGAPAPPSPSDTELFSVLERSMKAAEPGSTVAPLVGSGTTDSRFFRARGITAYGVAPFKVNYYDADGVHGSDERIRSRFFSQGVRLMKTIVRDFCAAK
ncbi:MAG: M20/M25/M40 family metallo-hydrolase [Thermoanaerobaculia bacterium]